MLHFKAMIVNQDNGNIIETIEATGKTARVINNKVNKLKLLQGMQRNEYMSILMNGDPLVDCFITGLQDYSCSTTKKLFN